jgi:hypothetical protein
VAASLWHHGTAVFPTENRKVGGSTPPLATTITAGQEPLTCGFVVLVGYVPMARLTASDRDIARMATSYRTSYRTELRSESSWDDTPTDLTSS